MCGLKGKECIAAFDPSHISKSGKKTYGNDRFWSGKGQRAKPGLEIGCLALVDEGDSTAYSIEVVQTQADMKSKLVARYVSIIKKNLSAVLPYTKYLTVDGYFMKKTFIDLVLLSQLEVITQMRPDANLLYLYNGPQKPGRGRK